MAAKAASWWCDRAAMARWRMPSPRPRIARPISASSLERSALFRLERASLSEQQLRAGLERKVRRAAASDGAGGRALDGEVRAWIEIVVQKMKRLGFVDDERVAAARARSLRSTGTSARGALAKLRQKGIDGAVAARALADVDADVDIDDVAIHEANDGGRAGASAELAAAREYVRRRNLHAKEPQKALAALARRGFSFDVAKRALSAKPT